MRELKEDLPMTGDEGRYGTIEERDGQGIVRLERRLQAAPDDVWTLLTDPDEVELWLAALTIEPHVGGAYTLAFENTGSVSSGAITRFEPPTLLEYRWHEGDATEALVRFALQPTDDGAATDLVLTHTLLRGAAGMEQYAAGWHAHLDLLAARIAGRAADWDWLRFDDLLTEYGGANDETPKP
jgi:uncharacterized protein YndB with AHSA1/START domain